MSTSTDRACTTARSKDRLGRWLDLQEWCETLLPGLRRRTDPLLHRLGAAVDRELRAATARAYVRALATNPKTITHFGRFEQERRCTINGLDGRRKFHFREEIRDVDVQLTTALMAEAFTGACEVAVVVTSNSELRVPITAVRKHGVRVGIVNPARGPRGQRPARARRLLHPPAAPELRRRSVPAPDPGRARDDQGAKRLGAALKVLANARENCEGPPKGRAFHRPD